MSFHNYFFGLYRKIISAFDILQGVIKIIDSNIMVTLVKSAYSKKYPWESRQ